MTQDTQNRIRAYDAIADRFKNALFLLGAFLACVAGFDQYMSSYANADAVRNNDRNIGSLIELQRQANEERREAIKEARNLETRREIRALKREVSDIKNRASGKMTNVQKREIRDLKGEIRQLKGSLR